MYLLDGMERGTPQRKTVYRISLTLVKRESLDGDGGEGGNPQAGACPLQRRGSVEGPRAGLEQLKEVEDESEDLPSPRGYMRNFRTFSTGQLELGRLKSARRPAKDARDPAEPKWLNSAEDRPSAENARKKRLLKAKSVEERSSEPPPHSNGKAGKAPQDAGTPPPKRPPGLLRRSFSFRHWTGGELLRIKALSKDKHHSSSGCIVHNAAVDHPKPSPSSSPHLHPSPSPSPHLHPCREKSRTLEVGAVLNKTDSVSELSRLERARTGKNRTLDNSDLQRLWAQKDASGGPFLLRGGAARSSERRLVRFFSGIFSRKDGAPGSPPVGSPGATRSLRRLKRAALSQSSTESVNGGSADGK